MKFIPVKTFDSYVTANIWLGRLQEENIVCYLQDEYSVTINPALSNAVGGIKLCVTPAQMERCRELICKFEAENALVCPDCSSPEIIFVTRNIFGNNTFLKLVADFFKLRPTGTKDGYHCSNCGSLFDDTVNLSAKPICSATS
jgi:hypothetical protein